MGGCAVDYIQILSSFYIRDLSTFRFGYVEVGGGTSYPQTPRDDCTSLHLPKGHSERKEQQQTLCFKSWSVDGSAYLKISGKVGKIICSIGDNGDSFMTGLYLFICMSVHSHLEIPK